MTTPWAVCQRNSQNGHNTYQCLIGILQWLCMIGRDGIHFSMCSPNHFSACPQKEQLKAAEKVFDSLKGFPDMQIKVDDWDLKVFPVLPTPDASFKEQCPDAFEELDEWFPILGFLSFLDHWFNLLFFYFDHAHNLKTKRSCTGIIIYIGSTPVSWSSKRQTSIQTRSYGVEFMGKTACQEFISIRCVHCCLDVRVKGPTILYGNTLIDLEWSKKCIDIAYHKMQECVAAGIVNPVKVGTEMNLSNFIKKG